MSKGGGAPKTLSKAKAKELNGLVDELTKHTFEELPDTFNDQLEYHRHMYGLLQCIQRIEPKHHLRITNGQRRIENVDTFTEWAIEHGCMVKNVRIAEQDDYHGLGLESTGILPPSEDFLQVPRSLFFYVTNEPRYRMLLELMPGATMREQGNIMLALALIMERFRAKSFWKPYLDVLPDRYTTPLYYTSVDMEELVQTMALQPSIMLCKNIARQYCFIRKFVQEKVDDLRDCFTYEVFRWAVSTVMTRQNKIPVNLAEFDDMDFTLALIPYWDMANQASCLPHRTLPGDRYVARTCYNAESDRLECCLEDGAESDGPIFIQYGIRSDAEFLVHNGFVHRHNWYTTLHRRFALLPSIPLYKERAHLLELIGMPKEGVFKFGYPASERPMSPELLSVARVSCMNAHDLKYFTEMEATERQKLSSDQDDDPAHVREAVLQWFQKAVKILLLRYPTTVEEDEALLKTEPKAHHIRRLLIEYRLVEKQTLLAWVTHRDERSLMSRGVVPFSDKDMKPALRFPWE